jgi:hypothetical protein
MNFDPRLRPLDIAIVVDSLLVLVPASVVLLRRTFPDADVAIWPPRIALGFAPPVRWARGRFFERAAAEVQTVREEPRYRVPSLPAPFTTRRGWRRKSTRQ